MNEYVVEEKETPNGIVKIYYDLSPSSPRDDSRVSTLLSVQQKYQIGDENQPGLDLKVPCGACNAHGEIDTVTCPICNGDMEFRTTPSDYFREVRGARVVLPVWIYDHSGITITCGERKGAFADRWDSSFLGFVFDTPEQVKECMGENATDAEIAQALKDEIAEYDQYLRGEVYGFEATRGDEEESCWGFYSIEDALSEGLAMLEGMGGSTPDLPEREALAI